MSGADEAPDRELTATLVETMGHPARGLILAAIAEDPRISAEQIARRLDRPVQKVRYHLRRLVQDGLIEVVETEPRRGVTRQFYRTLYRPLVEEEEFAFLSTDQKLKIAVGVFTALFADVSRELRAKTLHEYFLARVPLTIDPRGWSELRDIYRYAYEEVHRVGREAQDRLRDGKEDAIDVSVALICFQTPSTNREGCEQSIA